MLNRCLVRGRLNILGVAAAVAIGCGDVNFCCAAASGADNFGHCEQVDGFSLGPKGQTSIGVAAAGCGCDRGGAESVADQRQSCWYDIADHIRRSGRCVSNYDLVVGPDIAALRSQLRTMFPEERVEVSTSGPSLVLRGEVSNEVVYDRLLEVVATYLPPKPPASITPSTSQSFTLGATPVAQISSSGTAFASGGSVAFVEENSITDERRWPDKKKIDGVIDLLVIKEFRQIELDVVVAEISTGKLRDIGFDFAQAYKGVRSVSTIGSQAFGGIGSVATETGLATLGTAATGAFSWVNGAYSIVALYRMLQNKDIAQVLAQPRLVMKNGRSGSFLAGGEVPITTVTANTFGVIYKPFGVKLDFVPTITLSDRIDLRVVPEVSEIAAGSVVGNPSFKVRRTVSRVEMKEGESLIIGGLIDQQITKDLTKFPFLGDIPILGALFRSTSFNNKESELMIIITPRIVRTMKPGERPQLPSIEKYDDAGYAPSPSPWT